MDQKDKILEYIKENGERLHALESKEPIGDGFYNQPGLRYMGLANKAFNAGCGTCSLVGYCQFCARKYLTPEGRKEKP